ncbi:MAG: DUF86 domain-containing protein [Candidatus Nanohaloarchaea archaeon]|nr:DUF86 domain-containing protein [Candidatus Nanohaloarchaea archaeon]
MDEERVLHKLDQLDRYLDELKEDMPGSFEEYRQEKRKYERLLHLCIETVIDVSALILREEGLGTPSDEDDVIDRLVDAEVFSSGFGETLKDMKGFRNVLVHRYGEIDDRKVYGHLDSLDDFRRFRYAVAEYLDGE